MRFTHISTSGHMFFIISNKKNTTQSGQFQNTIGKSWKQIGNHTLLFTFQFLILQFPRYL